MANNSLMFKKGLYADLFNINNNGTQLAFDEGTVYFTVDEGGMYIDTNVKGSNKRVRIQGSVLYFESLTEFTNNVKPPYSTDVLYFIAKSTDNKTDYNALVRWDGKKWIQLNVTADTFALLETAVSNNATNISKNTTAIENNATDITNLKAWQTTTDATLLGYGTNLNTLNEWKSNTTTTLNNLSGTVDSHGTAIGSLQDAEESHNDRIKAIEDWQPGINSSISTLTNNYSNVDGRVKVIEDWKKDANTTINKNKTDIGTLNTTTENLQREIDLAEEAIEQVNTNLETAVENINKSISDLVGGDISTIKGDITGLQTRMTTAEGKIEDQGKSISTLQGTVSGHGSSITNLQTTVNEHGSSISTLQGTVSGHGSSISTLQTNLGKAQDAIEDIQTDIGNSNYKAAIGVTTITEALIELKDRLEGAGDLIQENAADITELKKLPARVEAVETKASANETNIKNLQDALDDLGDNLSDELAEHIKAANAMRFRGDIKVESASDLASLNTTDYKLAIGDTIVITKSFYTGANATRIDYHAGDLLIVSSDPNKENDKGILAPGDVKVTKVDTGYGEAHNLTLTPVSSTQTGDAYTAAVRLEDAVGNNLGQVKIIGSDNVTTKISGSSIVVGMSWGTF